MSRKAAGAVVLGVGVLLVAVILTLSGQDESSLPKGTKEPAYVANASAIGYAGPVLVRLGLSESGLIETIDIGGARFSETEGLGGRVREEAFCQQFISKKPPLKLGEDIDGIAGATLSSQAAVDAVNDAASFWMQ